MTKPIGRVAGLTLVLVLSFADNTVPEHWKLFKSNAGFIVYYPGSWVKKDTFKDALLILSTKGGAEALIIKPGQAFISVTEERNYLHESLEDVVKYYIKDSDVLSRRIIQNVDAGTQGCSSLLEIVSREPAIPAKAAPGAVPLIVSTEYFCELKEHKYVTVLRYFDADKNHAEYRVIALRIARSLRVHVRTER